MHIAVFDTGPFACRLIRALKLAGHEVTVGCPHPDRLLATRPGPAGATSFLTWITTQLGPSVLATYAGAASATDVLITTTPQPHAQRLLREAGSTPLRDKVIVTLRPQQNPDPGAHHLEVLPPTPAEAIQQDHPEAHVVDVAGLLPGTGRFPSRTAGVLVWGARGWAKQTTIRLIAQIGAEPVMDCWDLAAARLSSPATA